MMPFALQSEKHGEHYEVRLRRMRRKAYLAQTWTRWYCWSMWMPDEPDWSGPGMIWKHRGGCGKILFGNN